MAPVEFRYDVDVDHYVTTYRIAARVRNASWLRLRHVATALTAFLCIFALYRGRPSIALAAAVACALHLSSQHLYLGVIRLIHARDRRLPVRNCVVRLGEDGFEVVSSLSSGNVSWSAITSAAATPDGLLLALGTTKMWLPFERLTSGTRADAVVLVQRRVPKFKEVR